MSERLIMLDVPGVLYSGRSAARLGGTPHPGTADALRRFDPVAVGYVRRLFGLTGARVVLPHAWGQGCAQTLIQQLDLQVQAFAPAAGGFAEQIQAWLARQPARPHFTVLSADAALRRSPLADALVPVDAAVGLTVDDFRAALDKLGVACPPCGNEQDRPDPVLQHRLRQLGRGLATATAPAGENAPARTAVVMPSPEMAAA